ncbi:MAG: hypothetical protein QOF29_4080 [bacterium]|jgi:hypothetical protein|nr:hypothetical protein [Thermoleophilaceae bacterium]
MNFLLLGIDSLIACVAIGAIVDRGSRLRLVALFGAADLIGFMVGAGLGWRISDGVSGALTTGILVSLGLYLLVVAAGTSRVAANWPIWVVPFALTLDNLAFGLAGDHSAGALLQEGAQQALSSALLAYVGLLVAVALPRVLPGMERRATASRVAGGALVLAAGGLVLLG